MRTDVGNVKAFNLFKTFIKFNLEVITIIY